ncbi:hypothetical protein N0V95_006843 [Ascochyta clinopodiicola]|nr:hypothetical protein N0V95_006843 [Ascochyta clinopodiicola]
MPKPELTNVKLPPIHHVTPEPRFNYSSSVTNYDSDMSRRPSISSITSSGFHPSRSASPTFSTSTAEPTYGGPRSLDRLRMQTGHLQGFPYSTPAHESRPASPHSGGKASKKKRDDRKQYSRRASVGVTSSKVQKSDNEAGNRFDQAIDQANIVLALKEGNPNIATTAAPRNGSSQPGWTSLKTNNVNWDVLKDAGIQPSLWNKSCVNGSAILLIRHSNAQLNDSVAALTRIREQGAALTKEQLLEQLALHVQALESAMSSRGETDWVPASQRQL